jgi:GTPase
MNKAISYPKVLIIGRTNVGKSTLFNRLAEEKRSMVFDREGVTRDYIEETISWQGKPFTLIDTGGMSFDKHTDPITKRVREKVLDQLAKASILLFVVDGKNGLTEEDVKIAHVVRKTGKPVFLLINKADNHNALEENMPEFYSLGLDSIILVSGIHGMGIATLLNSVADAIPEPVILEDVKPTCKVAIIGRPNVGKSSLMNLLLHHERSIVSDVAGTTREPISENVYYLNDLIQLTDTAGVRRSRKIDDDLEQMMVYSSLQAVKDADLVIIMIDASEGKIADQELKLLFYAYEQRKMMLAVFNKSDLLTEYTRATLEQSIAEYEFILKKIPQIFTSCMTHKNVFKIFNEVQNIWARCTQKFNPQEVDELIKTELTRKYLYRSEQELKVHRVNTLPLRVPTFILDVNHPDWFGSAELNCIENILRQNYDLLGCPVRLSAREDRA